jgi:hypothetical protein
MMIGLGGLLLVPVLLVLAALAGAFPGGVLRVAGGALIGLAIFSVFVLGVRSRKAPPARRVRIMQKAPAEVIEARLNVPAKAR